MDSDRPGDTRAGCGGRRGLVAVQAGGWDLGLGRGTKTGEREKLGPLSQARATSEAGCEDQCGEEKNTAIVPNSTI